MDKQLWDNDKALSLIENENIPAIKGEDDSFLFVRDYDNNRVVLNIDILDNLIQNNQIEECISYLKSTDKVDYITLYSVQNERAFMINVNIKKNMTYLVPVMFEDDTKEDCIYNDDISYTKKAAEVLKEEGKLEEDTLISDRMIVHTIKNKESEGQFIPLFKTENELRIIYPRNKYRIGSITYDEAVEYAKRIDGIVYRPTQQSFIIPNIIAGLLTSIDDFKKIYKDFREYTQNEKELSDKVFKIGQIEKGTKEADLYYRGLLQNIHDLDKLYVILSKDDFNEETGKSVPLALTKDNEPAIYMFSDFEYAKKWVEHYNYYSDNNVPLIGEVKPDNDYDSLFVIAKRLGINLCMFNEGQYTLGFNINLFTDVNNMNQEVKLRITGEEAEILNDKSKQLNLKFNLCDCIGVENAKDDNVYYQIKIK